MMDCVVLLVDSMYFETRIITLEEKAQIITNFTTHYLQINMTINVFSELQ